MPKGNSADRELQAIKLERDRLEQAQAALHAREKRAHEAIAKRSNDALVAAFSKGGYGTVSKADATRLAKAVAALGIDAALGKLTA